MKNSDPIVRLETAYATLDALPIETRSLFGNWDALRRLVDRVESNIVRTTQMIYAEPAPRIGKPAAEVRDYVMHPDIAVLATARAAMEVLERSPDLLDARTLIEPLLLEIENAKTEIREVQEMLHESKRAVESAIAAAEAAALEAVKNSPEVLAARADYEAALEQAPVLAERHGWNRPPPPPPTDEEIREAARVKLASPGTDGQGQAMDAWQAANKRIEEAAQPEPAPEKPPFYTPEEIARLSGPETVRR